MHWSKHRAQRIKRRQLQKRLQMREGIFKDAGVQRHACADEDQVPRMGGKMPRLGPKDPPERGEWKARVQAAWNRVLTEERKAAVRAKGQAIAAKGKAAGNRCKAFVSMVGSKLRAAWNRVLTEKRKAAIKAGWASLRTSAAVPALEWRHGVRSCGSRSFVFGTR
ncbi:MAG: hypothetical protein ACLVJ6_09970 [Merdibacter sp.]